MNYQNDTICAISTPPGTSGIAVIRISGTEAIITADHYFRGRRKLQDCSSHTVHFGFIVDGDEILDEVYAMIFRAPHSYTGEDIVEISCHGNTFIANRILQLLLRKIRLAAPGEFTQRAFFNDKIDLTRAEAIADLLLAQTRRSHRAAIEQLEGSLYRRIELLVQKLTDYRTQLELEIDFLEQSIPEINLSELETNLLSLLAELKHLAASGEEGMILREGLRVSLVGAPNVGKSSIFNAFLESERAIVTPIPGTTRDYLEEAISLQGYLVRIFDTAGIRPAGDQIEQIGMERSYDIIKRSHLILFISDGNSNQEEAGELEKFIEPGKILKVLNKIDLHPPALIEKYTARGYIPCSTINQDGLQSLKEALLSKIEISDEDLHSGILTNTRQIAAVRKAVTSIEKGIESIRTGLGYEFTAFDLQEASSALEEIIGRITSDEILNRIFANFCIGK